MKLLLIDNRVEDIEFVTNCTLNNVEYIIFDFNNDTSNYVISKIKNNKYEAVGIFQHNYDINEYQLLKSFEQSILFNVEVSDPNLESWTQYIELIKYFKNTLNITTLDLMACNIGSSQDWNYIEKYLETNLNITVNSSIDNTGQGGNWILEKGNSDLIGKYFTNEIKNYTGTLGSTANSLYIIANDNKLYGCGSYSNILPMVNSVNIFKQVFNINIIKLSTSLNYHHTAIIKSDGSVWTVGYNIYGQLGDGTTTNRQIFTKVYTPINNVTAISISCGYYHTAMLLSDGSLWTVGYNSNGQLGDGTTLQKTNFVKVYTPSDGITATQVSCGYSHTAILLSDGSLWTVGNNNNGQLGDGTTLQKTNFVKVYTPSDGITVTQVSCGFYHTAMLLSDGSLWTVGYNNNGQLGDGTNVNKSSFVKVYTPSGGITATQVSCCSNNTTMLLSDGSLWTVGNNNNGQLGDGTNVNKSSFVKVYTPSDGITATQVSCGYGHTSMLLSDGSLWTVGLNTNGQLGDGTNVTKSSFVKVYTPSDGITATQVSCGNFYTEMLLSDGSLWTVGYNNNGQLGLGNAFSYYSYLTNVNLSEVTYCANGNSTTFAILSDGSLWGKSTNADGQLGDGTTVRKTNFVKVYTPSDGITVTQVSCDSSHTAMLLSDGSLWTVGNNNNGQLGDGTNVNKSSFVKVYTPSDGITATQVSCGYGHTSMLLSDGSLWTVGLNTNGQLGDGTNVTKSSFVKVYTPSDGITATQVSCGYGHTSMLLSDGSLWTVGYNNNGQLGDGTTVRKTNFVKVYTPSDGITATQVSCGYSHTAILLSDGSLWTVGNNNNGQLGDGTKVNKSSFVKVYTPSGGITATQVSCCSNNTTMLLSDGSLWTVGFNSNGQLGDGTNVNKSSFVQAKYDSITTITNAKYLNDKPIIVTINKQVPNITAPNNIYKTYTDSSFILDNPLSNSNGAWTFTSADTNSISISNNIVNILKVTNFTGITITASQEATNNYYAGFTTFQIIVNKSTPTIIKNLVIPNNKVYGDMPFTINYPETNNSQGLWRLTSSNTNVATINGNTITILCDGTTNIGAIQDETTNFNSFQTNLVELVVSKNSPSTPLILDTTEQLLYVLKNTSASYITINQNITNISKLTNNFNINRNVIIKAVNRTITIKK